MGDPRSEREERIRVITQAVLRELGRGGNGAATSAASPAPAPAFARSAAPTGPNPTFSQRLEQPSGAGCQGVKLVVFDMAGTIIKDNDNILDVFVEVAERHRLDTSREELNAFMGASKLQVFQHIIHRQHGQTPSAQALIEKAYTDFQDTLEEGYRRIPLEPIDGAEDTFRWLKARNIHVATTTGFYRKVMEICLERLGWNNGLIEASFCVDDVPVGRPAPFMIFAAMSRLGVQSVHQVVKVGDTPFDLMEGHNAGVRGVVGVLSGAHTAESFGRVRHTHILPSVKELPALIENEF